MQSPQELADNVVRNESWWGGTYNPPGDRRKLSALIADAIERALTEPVKNAGEAAVEQPEQRPFRKTKA